LSLVVPLALPDHGYGPHQALNPHQIWLMVLISAAWPVTSRAPGRRAARLLLIGVMGVGTSTATTVMPRAPRAGARFVAGGADRGLRRNCASACSERSSRRR
jgi:uncharacterized membrane protein (DUF4010 family)